MTAGNAAERWERCSAITGFEIVETLVDQAAAHGVRLEVLPDGRLWAVPLDALPTALRAALAEKRSTVVARLIRFRRGLPPPTEKAPLPAWHALPFGPERGAAFMAARLELGACRCCAGLDWWRRDGSRPICRTCHPPSDNIGSTLIGRGQENANL